jgi:hypothetical protein
MRKIKTTKVFTKEEIQAFKPAKKRKLVDQGTFYYPILFSEWKIEYKSLFKKERKSFSITGVDLIKGGPGFADHFPDASEVEADIQSILPPTILQEKQQLESREFIRKYYIHYKRVWSPPSIHLQKEEIVHMPYTIYAEVDQKTGKRKYVLFEHFSKNLDTLSNYPHIEKLCLPLLKGGDDK